MKRLPHLILSVDWDCFLPFDPDFCPIGPGGWTDTPDALQPDQTAIKAFWSQVVAPGCPVSLIVARDHTKLNDVAMRHHRVRIVNFDSHHDGGYEPVGIGALDCSNWALHLQRKKCLLDYTLVYPEWRRESPEEKSQAMIDRTLYGQWPDAPLRAFTIFVCRSDPWMPPWLDHLWIGFVNDIAARCEFKDLVDIEPEAMVARKYSAEPVNA